MLHIESTVTKVLVGTNQLVDALTNWSLRRASESKVSDIFVRLVTDFNYLQQGFEKSGIEMTYVHFF